MIPDHRHPPPAKRRTWANVVRNKSITLFEEDDYEETRRSQQAEAILNRAFNADAVLFDFGTNIATKAEAYRLIQSVGPILGAKQISKGRNSRALLIEARYKEEADKQKAISTGVTFHDQQFCATAALSMDADLIKVNFSQLPFVDRENLTTQLRTTMSKFGRVCQIRLYVEPETDTFEGEATVILDVAPTQGSMDVDSGNTYLPLTRFIHFEDWDDYIPASWKNAPPVCGLCNKEGHRKAACPDLFQSIQCYQCAQFGHIRRNCPLRRQQREMDLIADMDDTDLLASYPIIPPTSNARQDSVISIRTESLDPLHQEAARSVAQVPATSEPANEPMPDATPHRSTTDLQPVSDRAKRQKTDTTDEHRRQSERLHQQQFLRQNQHSTVTSPINRYNQSSGGTTPPGDQ